MALLNYTTKVSVAQTISEIQVMLVDHGASAVATTYADRAAVGISFQLPTPHGVRAFSLPVDVDAVQGLLLRQKAAGEFRSAKGSAEREQAARVAWRVLKDWVEAQLALIESEMASLDQVMLPYMHVEGEQTVYALYQERAVLELNPGH